MSGQEPTSGEAPFGSDSNLWAFLSGPAATEPTAELRQAAQTVRNAFTAYVAVGFTEPQALTLTAHIISPLRAS